MNDKLTTLALFLQRHEKAGLVVTGCCFGAAAVSLQHADYRAASWQAMLGLLCIATDGLSSFMVWLMERRRRPAA